MLSGVLAAALVLGACAHTEPFAYESDNEVKPGRGVFTGEDGAWTIYRQGVPPKEAAESAESGEAEPETKTPSNPNQEDQALPGGSDSE